MKLSIAMILATLIFAASHSAAAAISTSQLTGIASSSDGSVWVSAVRWDASSPNSDSDRDATGFLGKLSPTGSIEFFPVGLQSYWPAGIVSSSDGNLWFILVSLKKNSEIGRVTSAGIISHFALPKGREPDTLAASPGGGVYFLTGVQIGKMSGEGQTSLLSPAFEYLFKYSWHGMAVGSDGNIWVTSQDYHNNGTISRVTPDGDVTSLRVPIDERSLKTRADVLANSGVPVPGPSFIVSGSDGNMWFDEAIPLAIGKVTPQGLFSKYVIQTSKAGISTIVADNDGNIWVGLIPNGVGKLSSNGSYKEFDTPERASYMARGPDGNVWCVIKKDTVAKVTPSGSISEYPIELPR